MATNNPFSTRQVCSYFYKAVTDSQDEPTSYFRCQCSVVRKQAPKTGYSNLFDHVLKRHPDFVATMMASGTNTATLVSFIDQKSQTVFCWLDWTTACNLPFTWCEDPIVAKYTNLEHLSSETLLKYAHLVVRQVEIDIGLALSVIFGIMFDGWTFQSEHYLAVYAVFEHDGRADNVLLAFAPLIDDDVTDHSSASPVEFLEGILPFFGRDISDVVYLVGDNCAVNTKLADLLDIPLVGCASHRLNLAVQVFMADYEPLLGKIQERMRKLRNLNHSAKLRKKHFVAAENKLRALGDDLREFKSASKKLQGDEGVTLLDVRDIFDALIERHPPVAQYLAANAAIVKSPAFENACVKVLLGNEAALTSEEQKLLSPFAVRAAGRASDDAGEDDNDRAGFADRALRARKKQHVAAQVYRGVRFIPPMSNAVEQLFSKARHVLSLHRHRILPSRLEILLFLKINRRFWGAATVSKVVNA
ncbi:hypothetical protein PHYSODRAFT_254667 [Phytophthora sojae]|uniref:HAT C-terminal dimerisation domain-containing protein n=1 Tax=Phytophthora sojae (strain P6497) TaxID=1094619 RepID=G5A3L2_PHYSP|nr:hypothetical protein PHYSODRAFT_254667 [Phytophthora sojae]EGZ09385.1 hypothetical protein PHYSODRAFT_254667 [Phytophthora sojae]|eukprot:XP_009534246.1 hypothetical protein PHYSODRAFT_254667 [Phytophthora sojae]